MYHIVHWVLSWTYRNADKEEVIHLTGRSLGDVQEKRRARTKEGRQKDIRYIWRKRHWNGRRGKPEGKRRGLEKRLEIQTRLKLKDHLLC